MPISREYRKTPAAGSGAPVQRLADGGTVGIWERIKAGNIDEPGSEANMRWGSGKKALDAAIADNAATKPEKGDPMVGFDAPEAKAEDIPAAAPRAAVGSLEGMEAPKPVQAAEVQPKVEYRQPRKTNSTVSPVAGAGFHVGVTEGINKVASKGRTKPLPQQGSESASSKANADKDQPEPQKSSSAIDSIPVGGGDQAPAAKSEPSPLAKAAKAIGEAASSAASTVKEKVSGFGGAIKDTVKGIANSKITYQPGPDHRNPYTGVRAGAKERAPNTDAVGRIPGGGGDVAPRPDDERSTGRRIAHGGVVNNYADGGLIGGRCGGGDYSKKK